MRPYTPTVRYTYDAEGREYEEYIRCQRCFEEFCTEGEFSCKCPDEKDCYLTVCRACHEASTEEGYEH